MYNVKKYKTVNTITMTALDKSLMDSVLRMLEEFDEIYMPSKFIEHQSMAVEYLMDLCSGIEAVPFAADTHLRLTCHGKNIHADFTAFRWAGQSRISNISIAIHQNKTSVR